jgi:hypothetical protein
LSITVPSQASLTLPLDQPFTSSSSLANIGIAYRNHITCKLANAIAHPVFA